MGALLNGVMVLFALERGLEIVIHRRNSMRLRERGAVWVERDGFPLIVGAQAVLFVGTFAEANVAAWGGTHAGTPLLLAILLAAQALRYWCIATLGDRWAVRVVTLPGEPRVVGGPYRFLPHPNYLVVMAEAIALPLAFGAYATLLVVLPLQAIALARRIRIEEKALRDADLNR